MSEAAKACNDEKVYAVDSAPVPVCDNMRISRCRIYGDEAHRGYCASKRRYYYGLKIHLIVTATGQPVEFVLTPASEGDVGQSVSPVVLLARFGKLRRVRQEGLLSFGQESIDYLAGCDGC